METVKKIARKRGAIPVRTATGPVTDTVFRARREDTTWDTQWYNFRDQKWDRDGDRLTYRQAYNRAYHLSRQNPYAKIGVLLITGRQPKINGTSSPKVEVASDQ
jgi:hypothetical protein